MSRQLVESITSKNMLEANAVFEAKIAEIMERKMYEMKRMYAAESIKDPNAPESWKSGSRSGPEFEKFLARNREKYKQSKQEYKQAKKEYKKATGGKKVDPTDYEGQGNAPWTMAARAWSKAKRAVANHEPEPVGTKRVKVAKAVGSGIAKGVGSAVGALTKELGSISRF